MLSALSPRSLLATWTPTQARTLSRLQRATSVCRSHGLRPPVAKDPSASLSRAARVRVRSPGRRSGSHRLVTLRRYERAFKPAGIVQAVSQSQDSARDGARKRCTTMTCDHCEQERECTLMYDPFTSEVSPEEEQEESFWCERCAAARRDDI